MTRYFLVLLIMIVTLLLAVGSAEKEGLDYLVSKLQVDSDKIFYDQKKMDQIYEYINNKDYDTAIIYLMKITEDREALLDKTLAYIDLIYLLSIGNKYNESNFFISEFKEKIKSYDKKMDQWLLFIEIYNKSMQKTKDYDILDLIDSYFKKYPNGIWGESVLYLKAETYKKFKNKLEVIRCYRTIYKLNKNSTYFEEFYPVLKNYYERKGKYKPAEKLIKDYIKRYKKTKNLANEYFWLAQYYDSQNQTRKAKKYYLKLVNNKKSAVYPETIYWLAKYYLNKSKGKALSYFEDLKNFEQFRQISLKNIELLKK